MLDTKNVMRITCLVLLGVLGGATSSARWGNGGRWAAGVISDAVVGAPVGATVSAVVGTTALVASAYCEASPGACADIPRSALALSPTVLPEVRWMMAAEHTKGKRPSSWDKHTKTRSGGKEKKEAAKRKKESAKK